MSDTEDLPALIGPVARTLLGEPNKQRSTKTELRFGRNGSLSVDLVKGYWYTHEGTTGGGTLDLITYKQGGDRSSAMAWLRSKGFVKEAAPKTNGHDKRTNGAYLGRVAATYDYTDEAGKLIYQVVRYEPKNFRQRAPDGAGGWQWTVKGVRSVPYRLPDIQEAIALGQLVFIVEGEKDADTLWRYNTPATTNIMGAGKWRAEDTRKLVELMVAAPGGKLQAHARGR